MTHMRRDLIVNWLLVLGIVALCLALARTGALLVDMHDDLMLGLGLGCFAAIPIACIIIVPLLISNFNRLTKSQDKDAAK